VRCCFGMLPSSNVPLRANMQLHDTYPMHPYRLRVIQDATTRKGKKVLLPVEG